MLTAYLLASFVAGFIGVWSASREGAGFGMASVAFIVSFALWPIIALGLFGVALDRWKP